MRRRPPKRKKDVFYPVDRAARRTGGCAGKPPGRFWLGKIVGLGRRRIIIGPSYTGLPICRGRGCGIAGGILAKRGR